MKKTSKPKMGPLGTPLGNPLGYFNSQKGKRSAEPKQTLRKAQDGIQVGPYVGGTKDNPSNVAPTLKQAGIKNVYQGPLNERDSKYMDTRYPSTAFAPTMSGKGIPQVKGVKTAPQSTGAPRGKNYITSEAGESYLRNRDENTLRSNHPNVVTYNKYPKAEGWESPLGPNTMEEAEDGTYKRGGRVKKAIMKKGGSVKKTVSIKRKK